MKTKQITFTLLIAAFALALTSCDKDETKTDAELIIGMWNITKVEAPDGSGKWKTASNPWFNWEYYWIHFKDATNGEDYQSGAFTYTLTGSKLNISKWTEVEYATIINLTDDVLVIELGISSGKMRYHFIRAGAK